MEGNAKSQLRARVRVPQDPAHGPKYRTGDGGGGAGAVFLDHDWVTSLSCFRPSPWVVLGWHARA